MSANTEKTLDERIEWAMAEAKHLRGMLIPETLAQVAEWEREFGPYRTPSERVTMCRRLARKYAVTYREVAHAIPWFMDDGVVA